MTINRRRADARQLWKRLAFVLACVATLAPGRVFAQGAQLKLDALDALASRAKEAVNVSLDPSMMQMAGSFLAGAKNAGAQGKNIADLVAGLKGIYVRNYSFEQEGAYTADQVASIRSQLKSPWRAMVTTHENNESVDVYVWPEGNQMGGLAVVVAEPRELTVVNIVGHIDMALLSALGGSFGIPKTLGAPPAVAPPPGAGTDR